MRFLSFKALFVLVVLPPVLYVAALQGLEGYLEHHYRDVITNRIPGDTQALLAGRARLSDQLQAVVDDLIATGGTARATKELVHQCGAEVAAFVFVLNLLALEGTKRLLPTPVITLLDY